MTNIDEIAENVFERLRAAASKGNSQCQQHTLSRRGSHCILCGTYVPFAERVNHRILSTSVRSVDEVIGLLATATTALISPSSLHATIYSLGIQDALNWVFGLDDINEDDVVEELLGVVDHNEGTPQSVPDCQS